MTAKKDFLRALLFTLIFSAGPAACLSQALNAGTTDEETIYRVKVKQFNEFVDRFNYKTDFKGNNIDSLFASKVPRDKMLNYLFDLKDIRIFKGSDSYSADYVKTKKLFVDEVDTGNLYINKYSGKIIAEAISRVTYNGNPSTVNIFLKQEIVDSDMVKWVITDVRGEIFDCFRTDTTTIRFIPPGSNETDFINLKRALSDEGFLNYYTAEKHSIDFLSAFFFGIHSGAIRFEYVKEVIYHISDIPHWNITVREFNRNEMNSGWLITDLEYKSQ